MITRQQRAALQASGCEVAFDAAARQLYATDASVYQIEPAAVAFPRDAREAAAVLSAASGTGLSVTPRGAGTGLAGGALGEGVVVDFSRHRRRILAFDRERQRVTVESGVVLDQLNRFLRPHGLRFGPDVATSSRATLGGMIANNSSGTHTPVFGTTSAHVLGLELVLASGEVAVIGPETATLPAQRHRVAEVAALHAGALRRRLESGLIKRHPGYGLEHCLGEPGNLTHVLSGSEGTLAGILTADLRVVPIPRETGLGLVFFDHLPDAMAATVELLDLEPAAVEHLDRVLLDQTRGQRSFQAARDLLELDARPAEAVLAVEFFTDARARLADLASRRLGSRTLVLRNSREADLVWGLRKAGLSLLTGRPGSAKPTTAIEDTAVRPRDLPEYVAALQSLFRSLGLEASFYGHAASGLLHVRPVLGLHSPEDRAKFRMVADEVSALVRRFNGSLAAEHGVGIARTEYMQAQLGEDLLEAMREVKSAFDPGNVLNPGKILPDGRYAIDRDLRPGGEAVRQAWGLRSELAFAAKDHSFAGNLEQCNGCGGCRKETGGMCPTFQATGLEVMSTRGRANLIRAALDRGTLRGEDAELGRELDEALGTCLGCRACVDECPSNVNLALLKADLLHARIQQNGLTLAGRVFSSVDALGRMGTRVPALANWVMDRPWVRRGLAGALGLAPERGLPRYTHTRFDRWWSHRPRRPGRRGRVLLWDDTFVRYHHPELGFAAVKVLEAAGYGVILPAGRQCCGRPAFSQGNLAAAREAGRHNVALLAAVPESVPILFLEPSCYSMFLEDYRELGVAGAAEIARRCHLFERFVADLLDREPEALRFAPGSGRVVIHAHCHARATMDVRFLERLAGRLPGREARLLDTGCCGMAGAFGMMRPHFDLSRALAAPLVAQVRELPAGAVVVASGTSCRQQLADLGGVRAVHPAELLADALA